MTGNCGKPRAGAPLTARVRSGIAQHLRRVGCLRMNIARRHQMQSQDVASATDRDGKADRYFQRFAEGSTGSARAFRGGIAKMIAIICPVVCGLLARVLYLNWLPQPRRFAYALR